MQLPRTLALLTLAAVALGASPPLAVLVEVEPLGRGASGTVVGVLLQVAPEDRDRAGERVRVTTSLSREGELVERQSAVVALESDGSALLYREVPPGRYELRVMIAALEGTADGLWVGEIAVPEADRPFEAREDAPADALALELTPPRADAVRFRPREDSTAIGAVQLEVEAPPDTASVEFLHDGQPLARRNRPPWTVSVPLGDIVRRSAVSAVARDAEGRYLGEDVVVLNVPTGQLGVEVLLAPEATVSQGRRTVTVAVSGAAALTQVTLQLDDRTVARWADCPCVVELPVTELERAVVLTATAEDARGVHGDAVVALAQGAGTFRGTVTVELVELPVVVLDAQGVPVTDLQSTDFTVSEDGDPVTLEGFGSIGETELSLALAVDVSGSMQEEITAVRQALATFVRDLLRPGDEVSLLAFSWDASVEVPWTQDLESLRSRLDRVEPAGGTSLNDAVVRSLEQFRGRRGRQALVLLSDGEDTSSRTSSGVTERFVRTMRIPVFPVGLGVGRLQPGGRGALKDLARVTGGEAYFPKEVEELTEIYRRIGLLLRSQYLLWYRSGSEKPPTELREVIVQVSRPGLTVRTIRGYYPGR